MSAIHPKADPARDCLDTREGETRRAPGQRRGSRSGSRARGVTMPMRPVEFDQLIADEINKWAKVARV
jgi:hypothetical protein